jgi:hypothetical protein
VSGRKERNRRIATLAWSGADGAHVTVLRNGAPIATAPNNGTFIDELGAGGGNSASYQVCEVGGTACSAVRTVTF